MQSQKSVYNQEASRVPAPSGRSNLLLALLDLNQSSYNMPGTSMDLSKHHSKQEGPETSRTDVREKCYFPLSLVDYGGTDLPGVEFLEGNICLRSSHQTKSMVRSNVN